MGASAGFGIPAALLAGWGFRAASEFAAEQLTALKKRFAKSPGIARNGWQIEQAITVAALLFYSFIYATPIPQLFHRPEVIEQIGEDSRTAMQWIAQRTEPTASFVVISSAEEWYLDRVAEWFPYLAQRSSLTTAQGLEWAGKGVFTDKTQEISRFKLAQAGAPDLTAALVTRRYCNADYVAVFAGRNSAERRSFSGSAAFLPVFANQEVLVLRQVQQGAACDGSPPPVGALSGSLRNLESS
jgi:hypothetical protein